MFHLIAAFVLFGVGVLIASICSTFWPRAMWYLREGWKYKNVEPSDFALFLMRLRGVMGIIVSIAVIVSVVSVFNTFFIR
jgi:hypothetical protein